MPTAIARSVKVPDDEWKPFQTRAAERGETASAVIRRKIRDYTQGAESFRAEIYRDRQWWMIRVPEVDAITQASWEGEVWQVARALIGVTLDIDPATVNVELVILPGAKEE